MSIELIGGPEKREITLVEYDPRWPRRFVRERDRIATALGPTAVRIDHIGSTAVPGLAAKPIVDIAVSVPDVHDESSYLAGLECAGYELRVREPGHRMLRTAARDVHVHVWTAGGEWEQRHLNFRDRLRRSAEDRVLYERVKREIAARDWPTMNDYADAKSEVIGDILSRAATSVDSAAP
jgi:GrpB-like predicted nucleotidyltransferase (UPF0157 family)